MQWHFIIATATNLSIYLARMFISVKAPLILDEKSLVGRLPRPTTLSNYQNVGHYCSTYLNANLHFWPKTATN